LNSHLPLPKQCQNSKLDAEGCCLLAASMGSLREIVRGCGCAGASLKLTKDYPIILRNILLCKYLIDLQNVAELLRCGEGQNPCLTPLNCRDECKGGAIQWARRLMAESPSIPSVWLVNRETNTAGPSTKPCCFTPQDSDTLTRESWGQDPTHSGQLRRPGPWGQWHRSSMCAEPRLTTICTNACWSCYVTEL